MGLASSGLLALSVLLAGTGHDATLRRLNPCR